VNEELFGIIVAVVVLLSAIAFLLENERKWAEEGEIGVGTECRGSSHGF